jgi:hypothetical protein
MVCEQVFNPTRRRMRQSACLENIYGRCSVAVSCSCSDRAVAYTRSRTWEESAAELKSPRLSSKVRFMLVRAALNFERVLC